MHSPDGKRICFRSDRSGEEHLWVSKADGSDAVRISAGANRPSVGRWAPDGRAIVFNDPRTLEISIAREEAGRWRIVPAKARGVHPVYSPDGRWIYGGGPASIVRLPASGGSATTVLDSRAEALSMSPDGRYLYFVREQNATKLWRLAIGSRQVTQVLDGIVPGCSSCWSVAENGIYYLGSDTKSLDRQILYFHDLKTGEDRTITPYPEPLWPIGSGPFSLSPDGKTLACVRVDPSNSDVRRVTPFP